MDADLSRKRAKELIAQAEGQQGTFFLWRSKDNFSQAAQNYKEAGVQLKIATDYKEAGDLFLKSAEMYLNKCEDKMNAAISFGEAGQILKQVDATAAAKWLKKSAELYQLMGRAGPAAKIWDDVAVVYDQDLFDRDQAIKCHIAAGDCYRSTKSETSANGCYMKAANLMSQDQKWLDAVAMYEKIAEYYSRQTTMPHHVNNCCYKALLCMMVQEVKNENKGTVEKTKNKLELYTSSYPTFEDHDDARMVGDVIKFYEANDTESFQATLNKRKYKLDQWAIDMYLILKRAMDGTLATTPTGETAQPVAFNPKVHKSGEYGGNEGAVTGDAGTLSEDVASNLF